MENSFFSNLVKNQIFGKVDLNIRDFKAEYINGNTYFKACEWKWILVSRLLTIRDNEGNIGGVPFEVSDLSAWDFMIRNYDASDTDVLALDNFHWFVGTYKEVNNDFVYLINDDRDKLPMLWLSFTPTPSTTRNDSLNPIEFKHSFTMFFCASIFFQTFSTQEAIDNQLSALDEYIDAFIDSGLKNREYFGQDGIEDARYYFPKFGQFKGENGKSIIDSQLSGIEVRIDLNVKRGCKC